MKKIIFLLISLSITFLSYGQNSFERTNKIDTDVLNRIGMLYFSEKYNECLDSCEKYIGISKCFVGNIKHPFRDFKKIQKYCDSNDAEDLSMVLYFACCSAFNYSLHHSNNKVTFDGIESAKACTAIYNDYLHSEIPGELSSIDEWVKYVQYAENAISAINCGYHFLSAIRDEKWVKKEKKWFDKKSEDVLEVLYKTIEGKDSVFSNYPIFQYKVYSLMSSKFLKERKFKVLQGVLNNRIEAFKNLVKTCKQKDIDSYEIRAALSSLISTLCITIVENEICKNAGPDYERFCMENLIKLQDISYSLNGSNRYSISPNYSLQDIQNSLEYSDCAILCFEAPIVSGMIYDTENLSTRFRNYKLVITKNNRTPELWYSEFVNDSVVNDLSKIKKAYPNATKFYHVGTPRMSFIDVAGNDSSIVRLHSLSQLLQKNSSKVAGSEITFIGDLNYTKVSKVSQSMSVTKGDNFDELIGSAIELEYIKSLFSDVRPICGNDAKRNVVMSEISRSNGVIHISTHGKIFSVSNDLYTPYELILKKNVMENSCLILSGYNDTPQSSLCYMSGNDVLNIKRISSEIVFLDACKSGKGAVGVSGPVGIAEAFHLIGAKNVICYLESIEDYVATDFSNKFYMELSNGASCHDAFFRAKQSTNPGIKVVLWE